jgi:repressor LexA
MPTYTVKQQQVLEIVRDMLVERGLAPTLEEIGGQMGGISRVAVLDHLRALERKGAIRRKARESRAIEILDPDYTPPRGIPLKGTIAAGSPILEVEDPDEVMLEEYLGIQDETYLLRVKGDSMIEDHIQNGDLVLIERAQTAHDGETVVAVIDGETTLKRFYREGPIVRLQPANERLDPTYVPAERVEIRGVLRGVIRRT